MELKDRKYIKNRKMLPGYWGGSETSTNTDSKTSTGTGYEQFKSRWNDGGSTSVANDIMNIGNAALQFNSMKYPTNYSGDFVGKYGTNNYGSIDGINYTQYNDINTNVEQSRMSQQRNDKIMSGAQIGATTGLGLGATAGMLGGATLGGWLGPIGMLGGALLGGLFGGIFGNKSKREEERQMRIAQVKQQNFNEFSRTDALSKSLQKKELETLGNTQNQNLFSAAFGEEGVNPKTNETYKKLLVHTASGKKYAKQNAWVDNGEILVDKHGEHKVKGNPKVKDGEPAHLNKNTKVISNDKRMPFPGTNMTFAQVWPHAKENKLEDQFFNIQKQTRENLKAQDNMITARYGLERLPKFWGGYENLFANAGGLIQSYADYRNAASEDVQNINLRPYNKYEGAVANLMAGRRPNAYPIMQDLLNQEAKSRKAINQSGGLSSGQRTTANIANAMNTRIARANALMNIQNIYNQYLKENAEMLNQMGTSQMSANLDAQKFNTQINAAAHNAKVQQMNMAKRNALDYFTNYFKDSDKNKKYEGMYKLYVDDSKRKDAELKAILNSIRGNNTQNNEQSNIKTFNNLGFVTKPYEINNWFSAPSAITKQNDFVKSNIQANNPYLFTNPKYRIFNSYIPTYNIGDWFNNPSVTTKMN